MEKSRKSFCRRFHPYSRTKESSLAGKLEIENSREGESNTEQMFRQDNVATKLINEGPENKGKSNTEQNNETTKLNNGETETEGKINPEPLHSNGTTKLDNEELETKQHSIPEKGDAEENKLDISTKLLPAAAEDIKCSICQDSQTYTDMYQIQCTHTFHAVCLIDWLKRNPMCPICRLDLYFPSDEFDDLEGMAFEADSNYGELDTEFSSERLSFDDESLDGEDDESLDGEDDEFLDEEDFEDSDESYSEKEEDSEELDESPSDALTIVVDLGRFGNFGAYWFNNKS